MRELARAHRPRLPVALAIAGLDPSGGAGIVLDVRVFERLGVHPMAVAATLTVQTAVSMRAARPVAPSLLRAQLFAILEDGPRLDAVKLGALAGEPTLRVVAAFLDAVRRAPDRGRTSSLFGRGRGDASRGVPVVADPVFAASRGSRFLDRAAIRAYRDRIVPRADLVTPNVLEAEALSGVRVRGAADAALAAERIRRLGASAVLVKGGHLPETRSVVDVLVDAEGEVEFRARRRPGPSPHGTGCGLSSSIAAFLARGAPLREAVSAARALVARAIAGARSTDRGESLLEFS